MQMNLDIHQKSPQTPVLRASDEADGILRPRKIRAFARAQTLASAQCKLILSLFLAFPALPILAQSIPPFYGSGTAYEPQVSTINSGALLDARATVSSDQKHVTIGVQLGNNALQSIQTVPVVTNGGGNVGGVTFVGDTPPAPIMLPPPAMQTSPAAIERLGKSWILSRVGIYLVQPLH